MNTILQKRIEEAANTTVQNLYDYAKQTRNPKVSAYSEGYLDAIDVQGDFLFREGANYALSNQWISVEEALPPLDNHGYSKKVLVKNKYNPNDVFIATYSSISKQWLSDGYKFDVTHWMKIPTEGGEE